MFEVPYWSYVDVREQAERFLHQHHPTSEIPIPIEEIIDNQIGLHVVSLPELYRTHRQNGYLSKDLTTIWVDEYQYYNYSHKFRFTLARELGHYVLHPEIYRNASFSEIDEYVQWRLSLPPDGLNWLDTHASWFAGCVLVPSASLEQVCLEFLGENQTRFSEDLWRTADFWEYAAKPISHYFEVSPITVATQIRQEKIIEKLIRKINSRND